MLVRVPLTVLCLVVASGISGAGAQEPADPVPVLPPLLADSAAYVIHPLQVTVRRAPVRGKLAGFYRRLRRGAGRYVTREQIEERDPFRLSDVVQLVPGVQTVRYGDGSGRRNTRINRAEVLHSVQGCRIQYWLDGMPIPKVSGFDLDAVPPRDVAGIEVYRGPSETPARFQRHGSTCGTVVIWTRDPAVR